GDGARGRDAGIARGIDRALTVLGGDDDQRRVAQALGAQLRDELADGGVDVLDLVHQCRVGRAARIAVAAHAQGGLDQLLPDAHRLVVHAEDVWHWRARRAVVFPAVDLVQDA